MPDKQKHAGDAVALSNVSPGLDPRTDSDAREEKRAESKS